jgi:uncharacterized protein involved in outer membrane biogenesis
LRYATRFANQTVEVTFENAELTARKNSPISAAFNGTLNGAPFAVDLNLDIRALRVRTEHGDLGNLISNIRLKDGLLKSSLGITGFTGARINSEFKLNAAEKPPMTHIQLSAEDFNYGFLLGAMKVTELLEGRMDIHADISGAGATRYRLLKNVEGHVTLIGGPGAISSRTFDLWAADLISTMFSPRWQRQTVTHMNCFVAHINLKEGLAKLEDLILDTRRITIAGSGILNLETEAMNLVIAPRPKRPSLVSLAYPVEIKGTLSEPEISVTRLHRRGRLARAGILAGLINPAFLLLSYSDIGTGFRNPCVSAVERAYKSIETNPPRCRNISSGQESSRR